jgi:CBS domain containing-hemolysin-like protein
MVHIRDCLRAITENKASSKLREFARPIVIVPENKKIVDLLAEFKKTKTHMAIVVDEYGSTRGLATIEDLLEELVGDIADEYDIVEEYIVENPDGSYTLDARMPLEDVCENLDIDLEDEEFNTIGGHVFGKLGREPQIGDVVEYDDYVFTILESDRHRIIKVKFTRLNNKEETSDTGDAQENLVSAEKEAGKAVESSK